MNLAAASSNQTVYYRLIALWVLCEAMLGGVIHAARIPVSGLIVGSCAVFCICLIAFYFPKKGAIIRATIIVAVFKMMLSPQSPPLAYFAVFFQGSMGEIIFFSNRKFYRISCLLLGIISLLESGLQRIAVLTIIYGNKFWKAINDFISELTGQDNFTNYSLWIGGGYVAIHITAGIVVGWWAGIVPEKIENWKKQFTLGETGAKELPITKRKKRKWFKKGIFMIWIILILLYAQSYFRIGQPILPSNLPLQILIRSFIIIFAWYFAISPFISFLLKKWLKKKQSDSGPAIQKVTQMLPDLRSLIVESWKQSSVKKGIGRIFLFSKNVVVGVIYY